MYELSPEEKDFLQRFGNTGNGRELYALLEKIKNNIDRTSTIPKDSDYGAQVEGRRLTAELITKISDCMKPKKGINFRDKKEVGVDEFD